MSKPLSSQHNNLKHNLVQIFAIYLPMVLFILLILIPFVMLISSSITSNDVIVRQIVLFPKQVTFKAYQILFAYPEQIIKSYLTTIVITLSGLILNMVLCCLIAYPLADVQFKHRPWVSFLVFFTMLFNAGLIPTYIVVNRLLNLHNTIYILILIPMLQPGHIFFLRVFFQNVPSSLYESARIDGANEFKILAKVATPLILPGLATIAFQFVLMYWNDAFTPLYFADDITPIALYIQRWRAYIEHIKIVGGSGLGGLIGSGGDIPDLTVQFAMGVITTLPLIAIFTIFQKYFIDGLTAGAVKG